MGGKKIVEKEAKIGDELYHEYGFYFELKSILEDMNTRYQEDIST